ncbi:hypothetical protein JCM17823_29360 [Halorubrum gandharaense]
MASSTPEPRADGPPITVHVGDDDALLQDARRAQSPDHLIVTPVDLHQRNIERRLREAARPKSSLAFARIRDVAERVATAGDLPDSGLDRVDRLALIREALADAPDDRYADLAAVLGEPLANHVESLERTRSELELVTGFKQRHMAAFEAALAETHGPVHDDTLDLLDGVARLHDDLRERLAGAAQDGASAPDDEVAPDNEATQTVSETGLLARASDAIADDPDLWTESYPDIERLSVAGASMLTAPLERFCRVVARETAVDVHLHLRPASGPAIAETLGAEATAGDPLDRVASPPAVEVVARTRQEEARAAVATVAGLVDRGVSPSDIAITAVDVDPYEDALTRAARRYGMTLAVWTPLRLKRTEPYRLLASTVDALRARDAANGVTAETLAEPLRFGWVPADGGRGPVDPAAVDALVRDHPDAAYTLTDWRTAVAESALDTGDTQAWMAYCNWLDAQPSRPSPEAVRETLVPLLDGYEAAVLPDPSDGAVVSRVAETVRGFDRTEELLRMTGRRYDKWLDYGRADRRWDDVAGLLDAFASTVPGRRELPTAAAVDVVSANDLWALEVPYVVAVGLVDSEWPRTPASAVPSAARAATVRRGGDDDEGTPEPTGPAIRPHSTWTTARDHDHFVAAVDAATQLLVATRYAEDGDGVERRPSRFLADLETTPVEGTARDDLVGDPTALPAAIAEHVTGDER